MKKVLSVALALLASITVASTADAQCNPVYNTTSALPACLGLQQLPITVPSGQSIEIKSGAALTCDTGATCAGFTPSGTASGDLGGTYPGPTVLHLSHVTDGSLANSGLAHTGFTINSVAMVLGGGPYTIGAAPTGTAGGDLGGSYPNPSLLNASNLTGTIQFATFAPHLFLGNQTGTSPWIGWGYERVSGQLSSDMAGIWPSSNTETLWGIEETASSGNDPTGAVAGSPRFTMLLDTRTTTSILDVVTLGVVNVGQNTGGNVVGENIVVGANAAVSRITGLEIDLQGSQTPSTFEGIQLNPIAATAGNGIRFGGGLGGTMTNGESHTGATYTNSALLLGPYTSGNKQRIVFNNSVLKEVSNVFDVVPGSSGGSLRNNTDTADIATWPASATSAAPAMIFNTSGSNAGISLCRTTSVAGCGFIYANGAHAFGVTSVADSTDMFFVSQTTGNVTALGTYTSGSSTGVSCSGTPTSSFASVGGIVTHC